MDREWLVAQFSDCPPLSYELRTTRKASWVRFHSLPESKRYPEHDGDWEILLERHQAMAAAVLGTHTPAILIEAAALSERSCTANFRLGCQRLGELDRSVDPADSESNWWAFGASEWRWDPQALRAIIREVAEDRGNRVLFIGTKTGEIYAPYDGGADLFVGVPERFRQRWPEWLSGRADGL